MSKIDDEVAAIRRNIEAAGLLYQPSDEEIRIIIETTKIRRKLLDCVSPWGELTELLCGRGEEPPTHKPTEETMILLEKMKDFWKLVKESLVPCPRESLQ